MSRFIFVLCALCLLLSGCQAPPPPVEGGATATPRPAESPVVQESPSENDLVFKGTHLFEKTYEKMPEVKAKLHCASCHLQGGTAAGAAPLVGLAAVYPEKSQHTGLEIDLAGRVNECLERNMNGPSLTPESEEMKALLAYMDGLSADPVPERGMRAVAAPESPANSERGQGLFAAECASCHQMDGSGTYEDGAYMYPALWGENSFTSGAEMAKAETLAAFIAVKMPLGRGRTLTEQEVWDIATYVSEQARPEWPKGE